MGFASFMKFVVNESCADWCRLDDLFSQKLRAFWMRDLCVFILACVHWFSWSCMNTKLAVNEPSAYSDVW